MITGLTSTSKKNFQLDAGALFKNYNPTSDTPSTAASKLIGATQGGFTAGITGEWRQFEVDGVKGPTKGYEVLDTWNATISTTVKEVTADTIALALGAATATAVTSPANYTKVTLDNEVADSDYIGNVTWIGKIIGATDPMMIVFKNVLGLNGLNFQVADKNEGGIPLTLTAHYDPADLDKPPVEIYMPTVSTQ